jgi:Fe-S cluster biosynthesis and repair protein YggX
MIVKKQMIAIRKVAQKNHALSPEYFTVLIAEIDLKLKELDEQEFLEDLAELETYTFEESAQCIA